MSSQHDQRAIRRVERLLGTFRSAMDETIPIQIAHTFIVVALNEGKGVLELAELVGTNKSTMSRHLLDLSTTLRNGRSGYGLLNRAADAGNLRTVSYTLSARGKLLLHNLLGILGD